MPNWCYNECFISGPRNEVKPLFENLRKWTSQNYKPNGFDIGMWIGNIVLGAGFITESEEVTEEKPINNLLLCRGQILSGFEYHHPIESGKDPYIWFTYESAWAPLVDTFESILKRHAPNCKFYYFAEEPGMGIHQTNDANCKFFNNDFYIDYQVDYDVKQLPDQLDEIDKIGAYATEKELKPLLQKILDDCDDNIKNLIYKFNRKYAYCYDDKGFSFEIFEIEVCE